MCKSKVSYFILLFFIYYIFVYLIFLIIFHFIKSQIKHDNLLKKNRRSRLQPSGFKPYILLTFSCLSCQVSLLVIGDCQNISILT